MSGYKKTFMSSGFSGDQVVLKIGSTQICSISYDRGNGVSFEEAIELGEEIAKRWNISITNPQINDIMRESFEDQNKPLS